MLKIKDSVDLKELEKFGFVEDDDWYCFKSTGYGEITIHISSRTINFEDEWYGSDFDKPMETFFDIIQAGLVEKVEEKNK